MAGKILDFAPGKEPEIVYTQPNIPAPRMVAVSVDALQMMVDMLHGYTNNPQLVRQQLIRILKDAPS